MGSKERRRQGSGLLGATGLGFPPRLLLDERLDLGHACHLVELFGGPQFVILLLLLDDLVESDLHHLLEWECGLVGVGECHAVLEELPPALLAGNHSNLALVIALHDKKHVAVLLVAHPPVRKLKSDHARLLAGEELLLRDGAHRSELVILLLESLVAFGLLKTTCERMLERDECVEDVPGETLPRIDLFGTDLVDRQTSLGLCQRFHAARDVADRGDGEDDVPFQVHLEPDVPTPLPSVLGVAGAVHGSDTTLLHGLQRRHGILVKLLLEKFTFSATDGVHLAGELTDGVERLFFSVDGRQMLSLPLAVVLCDWHADTSVDVDWAQETDP